MMKKIKVIQIIFALFFTATNLFPQEDVFKPEGSWLGSLNVGAVKLRLVFNISRSDDGALKATMDSPDQGAKGIPMGEVSVWNDSIKIDGPVINGFYLGKIESPSRIVGIWSQGGQKFDVDIDLQVEEFMLNRPQEPKPPFSYTVEDVTFENKEAGISLAGTITRPNGKGPFPAVILVSGSGQQNRDEAIFGHKPFMYLADQLTRKGIVVLRYDDRGVGGSGGDPRGGTSLDFAGDAQAALDFVGSMDYTDKNATGIIGHSEGGLIAFILASGNTGIDFIVSLAGPGVKGSEVLLDQSDYISRLNGVAETEIELNRSINSRIYDIMAMEPDVNTGLEKIIKDVRGFLAENDVSPDVADQVEKNLNNSLGGDSYNWLRYFVITDPAGLMENIKCPVLALNGDKDCQVMAEKNINAIKSTFARTGNKNIATKIFPGLNHLFQNATTGLPDEYGIIEETMDPAVPALVTEWILNQL